MMLALGKHSPAAEPFADAVKRGLHAEWWPSLNGLQKAAYRTSTAADRAICKDVISEWTNLGHGVGLDEKKERRRHEHEAAQRCSCCVGFDGVMTPVKALVSQARHGRQSKR